jgi:uncharacterized membrane protein
MGMEAHIAAGLSYIWIVGLIFFFVEKSNRFVRFHAAQSILLGAAGIVLYILDFVVLGAIDTALFAANANGSLGFAGICVFTCIPSILGLVLFGFFIWGLIAGSTGQYVKFPIIGDIAERMAGGPIPA